MSNSYNRYIVNINNNKVTGLVDANKTLRVGTGLWLPTGMEIPEQLEAAADSVGDEEEIMEPVGDDEKSAESGRD